MENITISMEEYKELLIIKGKYEELKSQQVSKIDWRIKEAPIVPLTMPTKEISKQWTEITCNKDI